MAQQPSISFVENVSDGNEARLSSEVTTSLKRRQSKIGHWRKDVETGEITYKKKSMSELMGSIQLGIAESLKILSAEKERDILIVDFASETSIEFRRDGLGSTPSHEFSDFYFKTYAEMAFRHFRKIFNIDTENFLTSLCKEALKEVTNPGASGSVFYLSNDDRFIIKTVQSKEARFFKQLLSGYYMNLKQNPDTLLPKFYGQFCYHSMGKNIRLLVMNNLLPSNIVLHEKYDLKGSTYKRKASEKELSKSTPTLKDLDFIRNHPESLILDQEVYNQLKNVVHRDCQVLQSFQIMDYSLLLGIHNITRATRLSPTVEQSDSNRGEPTSPASSPNEKRSIVSTRQNLKVRWSKAATTIASQIQQHLHDEIGLEQCWHSFPARNDKGDRLMLYVGIIDILQQYRTAKKIEHAVKSIRTDGKTVSVTNPRYYGERFENFLFSKVFKADTQQHSGARFRRVVEQALTRIPSRRKSSQSWRRSFRVALAQSRQSSSNVNENEKQATKHMSINAAKYGLLLQLPSNVAPPTTSEMDYGQVSPDAVSAPPKIGGISIEIPHSVADTDMECQRELGYRNAPSAKF